MRLSFKGLVGHIRSWSLMSCVGDETLAGWEIESIKGRWEGISTLKNLTIYATLIYRRADDFFEDYNLNNFRPMVSCRLPRLIYMFSSHHPYKALLEIVIRRLSLRAKDILLKRSNVGGRRAGQTNTKFSPSGKQWKKISCASWVER
jgi:hypothetical protein